MAGKDVLRNRKTLKSPHFIDEVSNRVEEIRTSQSIVKLFAGYGVSLKGNGKSEELKGLCPWHNDKNPSLYVNDIKGVYKCHGCGQKGNAFTLVQKMEGKSFREALKKLEEMMGGRHSERDRSEKKTVESDGKKESPEGERIDNGRSNGLPAVKADKSRDEIIESSGEGKSPAEEGEKLPGISLNKIAEYYHKKLYENEKALSYLTKRGLKRNEIYARFRIGYAHGDLPEKISEKHIEELKEIGILRENGKEHFLNCITFPIFDDSDKAVGFYGRSINDKSKTKHLYLKGKHKGVFNRKASKVYDEIILTESIIDALSLIELGYENVQSIYGTNGFTDEHLQLLKDDRVKTVILAFDADDAGKEAGEKLKEKLISEGFGVKIISPPVIPGNGEIYKDWNDYLVAGGDYGLIKSAIEKAEFFKTKDEKGFKVEKDHLGYIFTTDEITYRVSGVREMFVSNLRVNIRAEIQETNEKYYNNLDLYSARSRASYSLDISREHYIDQKRVEKDLINILEYLEEERDRILSSRNKTDEHLMTEEEIELGMDILKDRNILERVTADMEMLGYVGEEINKHLMFTAACSRKLNDPLDVMVISQSSGGKTRLVETVEMMMPPEDVISVTSLSDQALNYVKDMEHKFLVLGEAVYGVDVENQLRDVQSSHKLKRGVVVKDPKTGKSETEFVTTKAVVSCALTGTNRDINPENASRNFIIEVDESDDQTSRVHEKQQEKYSFERQELEETVIPRLIKGYHAAGRLLRKLFTVNNFAKNIRFPKNLMRTRRDHERFLDLIAAVCFIRQYQKNHYMRNNIEYIKCDLVDYRYAHNIIMKVMTSTLCELTTGTIDFYDKLREMVRKLGKKRKLKPHEVIVTQREIREYTGYSLQWVKKQLRILVEYEYVIRVKGGESRTRGYYRIREDKPIEKIDLSMIPTPEEMAELIKNDKDDDEDYLISRYEAEK